MRRFTQVDVFTDRLGYGNALAVVHDSDELGDAEMARFARWTQLSETTFLHAPTDPGADYRVRIFTTSGELPFAGHPTLGSARAWLSSGLTGRTPGQVVQECEAGLVTVRQDGSLLWFAAPPLRRSGPVDPADAARITAALGLHDDQVLDVRWADNGPGWIALLLPDAATVLSVKPDVTALRTTDMVGIVGAHPPGSAADFEVRAFALGAGVEEDPVTGSLNAAIGQWLIPAALAPERYVVAQGTVLGRAGRVHVEHLDGQVWVGGDTVIGVSGTVAL